MDMAKTQTAPKANQPIEVRIGRIKAALWENETANGTRYNVTFVRLWRDDQGKWNDSDSFGRDDLLLLARVAEKAHDRIYELGAKRQPGDEEAPY